MKRTSVVGVVALLLVAGFARGLARASEQSELLYSRGLVEFHAGRFAAALELFDRAVQADPEDVYSRFYRGLTAGRLNNFAGAISDLRAVLAQRPDFDQAALELGVALVQSGSFQDAQAWLEQAQRVSSLEGEASLFLGIAYLREAQLDRARENFQRAARSDPSLEVAARYYQGIIDYREGNLPQAQEQFSYVATTSPDTDIGHQATVFLATIRQTMGPVYQLYGLLGFQYDSNVVLAPSNQAVKTQAGISNQADGQANLAAGGIYVPWRTEQAEVTVGYDFYQTLHFQLTNYNVQDHRFNAQAVVRAGPVQFGLLGRYDYYLLQTDSFLQEATVLPWATLPDALGRTEVFCQVRRRDFLQQAFDALSAWNYSPGLRRIFYLGAPERYATVGYRFDSDNPVQNSLTADSYAYDGNEISAGIGWAFPFELSGELDYLYRHEQYAEASTADLPTGVRRRDDEQQILLVLRKQLSQHLALIGGYLGTFNNSNKTLFEYNQQIGSLALEVRF